MWNDSKVEAFTIFKHSRPNCVICLGFYAEKNSEKRKTKVLSCEEHNQFWTIDWNPSGRRKTTCLFIDNDFIIDWLKEGLRMFRLAVLSIRFCDLVSVSRLLSLITQIIWKTHSGDTVLISLFSSFILSKTDVLESLHKRTVYQISRILSEPRNKGHFGYRASLFVKSNECKSHHGLLSKTL